MQSTRSGTSAAVSADSSGTLHLLYHQLCRDPQAYRYTVAEEQFDRQLSLLTRLRQAVGCPRPALTFDDGNESDADLALPLLEEHGWNATFFITAGWTGKRAGYMNAAQLRMLHAAGHTIGAHGWSHALLPACTAPQLQQELGAARALLEDTIGAPVQALSFPGGRYNRAVLRACRAAGYTRLYTSNPSVTGLGASDALIGRLNVRADTSTEWLERLFEREGSLLRSLQRVDHVKRLAKQCLGDTLYAALWRVVNRAEADA